MKYAHILNYFESHPWAITDDKLQAILTLIELRASGFRLTQTEIDARIGNVRPTRRHATSRDTAVIPIHGVIAHRTGILEQASGGTSIDSIRSQFRTAIHDPDVEHVILDIDSPGGSTAGLQEMADEIHRGRREKRITAVANTTMASAAYYLGSQAHEVVATPSAMVGSIGVVAVHFDETERMKQEGVKATIVKAGKFKAEGTELEPLTDEAHAHIQGMVDARHEEFVAAVARGRGTTEARVRGGFGEGRMVLAKKAVRMGLADRVETFDRVVNQSPAQRSMTPAARDAVARDAELRQLEIAALERGDTL